MLIQEGTIYWLRAHNFGSSFPDKILDPLYTFEQESFKSDFEFLNPEIESLKNNLLQNIKEFNQAIITNTFGAGPNFQSVPKEWTYEQPERHDKAVNHLNNLADNICMSYDTLIKYGRRTLKV